LGFDAPDTSPPNGISNEQAIKEPADAETHFTA
jgi:hypothetical protein